MACSSFTPGIRLAAVMAPALTIGLSGGAGGQVEGDGVERLATGLDADVAAHALLAQDVEGRGVDQRLGHRLEREPVAGVAGLVGGAVHGHDGDPEQRPGRRDASSGM